MTFARFKAVIGGFIAKAGISMDVRFSHDIERGRFSARFSDGTIITGHPSGRKITVRYGSGHQMMIAV